MYSESLANLLMSSLGRWPYLIFALAMFSLAPFGFIKLMDWRLFAGSTRYSLDGLALGLGVAAWASVCWLTIPYCGGYPSLVGLLFSMVVSGFDPPVDTMRKEIAVHAGNLIVWPLIGWVSFLVFRAEGRSCGDLAGDSRSDG